MRDLVVGLEEVGATASDELGDLDSDRVSPLSGSQNQGEPLVILGCTQCHPNCKTCFGPGNTKCITCATGYNKMEATSNDGQHKVGECVDNCPTGTFR